MNKQLKKRIEAARNRKTSKEVTKILKGIIKGFEGAAQTKRKKKKEINPRCLYKGKWIVGKYFF